MKGDYTIKCGNIVARKLALQRSLLITPILSARGTGLTSTQENLHN